MLHPKRCQNAKQVDVLCVFFLHCFDSTVEWKERLSSCYFNWDWMKWFISHAIRLFQSIELFADGFITFTSFSWWYALVVFHSWNRFLWHFVDSSHHWIVIFCEMSCSHYICFSTVFVRCLVVGSVRFVGCYALHSTLLSINKRRLSCLRIAN